MRMFCRKRKPAVTFCTSSHFRVSVKLFANFCGFLRFRFLPVIMLYYWLVYA